MIKPKHKQLAWKPNFVKQNFADHCYDNNTDFNVGNTGTDIEPKWKGVMKNVDNALSCQHYCQKNDDCEFWTYTEPKYEGPGNSKTCYLKTEMGNVKDLKLATSGPKYCSSKYTKRLSLISKAWISSQCLGPQLEQNTLVLYSK